MRLLEIFRSDQQVGTADGRIHAAGIVRPESWTRSRPRPGGPWPPGRPLRTGTSRRRLSSDELMVAPPVIIRGPAYNTCQPRIRVNLWLICGCVWICVICVICGPGEIGVCGSVRPAGLHIGVGHRADLGEGALPLQPAAVRRRHRGGARGPEDARHPGRRHRRPGAARTSSAIASGQPGRSVCGAHRAWHGPRDHPRRPRPHRLPDGPRRGAVLRGRLRRRGAAVRERPRRRHCAGPGDRPRRCSIGGAARSSVTPTRWRASPRAAAFSRMRDRMSRELSRNPGSAAAGYWVAVAHPRRRRPGRRLGCRHRRLGARPAGHQPRGQPARRSRQADARRHHSRPRPTARARPARRRPKPTFAPTGPSSRNAGNR